MVSKGSGDHREIWNLNLLTQMKLHVFFVSVVFLPGSPMRVDDLFSPPQILMAPVGTRALIEGLFGYPIIPPSLVQSWDPSSLRHCTRLVLPLLYLFAFGKEFIGLLEHRFSDRGPSCDTWCKPWLCVCIKHTFFFKDSWKGPFVNNVLYPAY